MTQAHAPTHSGRPWSSPVRPNRGDDHTQGWSSVVPLPTGTTITAESDDHHPKTTSQIVHGTTTGTTTTWHYVDHTHPSTTDWSNTTRTHTCPTCGAPPGAACNGRHGRPLKDHLHHARVRLAHPLEEVTS